MIAIQLLLNLMRAVAVSIVSVVALSVFVIRREKNQKHQVKQ